MTTNDKTVGERFCNKCGYWGPDVLHQRPNGSGQCGYLSCLTTPSKEPAGAVAEQVRVAPGGYVQDLIDWAVERWHDEVKNRPMVNIHRRSLDDTWRQVLRHLGVDDRARLGPTHDELRAEIGSKEWERMNGAAPGAAIDAREQEALAALRITRGHVQHNSLNASQQWMRTQAAHDLAVVDEALAPREDPPAVDAGEKEDYYSAKSYAANLATALFNSLYAKEPDYASGKVVWGLCDSLSGILTQIDNMVSGLVKPPASASPATVAQPTSVSSFIDTIQPWTMEHLKAYPKAALEILNKRIAEANIAQPCPSQGCAVDVYSSRMCELGTKGCTVAHAALSTAKSVEHGATDGGTGDAN